MGVTRLYIATEDVLSEAVAARLVTEVGGGLCVAVRMGRKGNGYLRLKVLELARTARSIPVLLLTDLDRDACPPGLIDSWIGRRELPENMLFRVAVREIESWVLADRMGFSRYFSVPIEKMPRDPESLDDPKQVLLALIRRYGNRIVKANMLPERGTMVAIGLGYNETLMRFVQELWSVNRAAACAESLARAYHRLWEMGLRV